MNSFQCTPNEPCLVTDYYYLYIPMNKEHTFAGFILTKLVQLYLDCLKQNW
jgi:hypothetical protein